MNVDVLCVVALALVSSALWAQQQRERDEMALGLVLLLGHRVFQPREVYGPKVHRGAWQ
jgi:hypothetical protein